MYKKRKSDKQNKAIKCRLFPTEEQAILICKTFGCCRFLWNEMLGLKEHYWQTEHIFLVLQPAWFKEYYPFLNEVDSMALDSVKCDLNEAFSNFFNHNSKYPKYKSRAKAKRSYRTNNNPKTNNIRFIDSKHIKLPKLGIVELKCHRDISNDWVIKSCTISQDSEGKFYISILFEFDKPTVNHTVDETKAIGLDYKSDGFYVDSEGNEIGSPKYFRKKQKHLAKEQRKLSRKIESHIVGYRLGLKGGRIPIYDKPLSECKNIQKQLRKVNKTHVKIANQRKDFCHKKAYHLAENYDIVCIEDINLRAMSNKGFGNGKATTDNGFGMFRTILEYKLLDRGKYLVKVDKFFPSSQICKCCGQRKPMPLNIRTYRCDCGYVEDRDYNAAKNIRDEGLRIYRNYKQLIA